MIDAFLDDRKGFYNINQIIIYYDCHPYYYQRLGATITNGPSYAKNVRFSVVNSIITIIIIYIKLVGGIPRQAESVSDKSGNNEPHIWEKEKRRVVPDVYDFRAGNRAPIIQLGHYYYCSPSL